MGVPWLERPLVKKPEERYIDAIKELDNIFLSFKNENEVLKKQVEDKDSEILKMNEQIDKFRKAIVDNTSFYASITPCKVYHNKKRGNTTVKFLDDSSVTVHKMDEDEDSIETAIVYAIYKKLYPKKLLKCLVADVTETGGNDEGTKGID